MWMDSEGLLVLLVLVILDGLCVGLVIVLGGCGIIVVML